MRLFSFVAVATRPGFDRSVVVSGERLSILLGFGLSILLGFVSIAAGRFPTRR
jgi:hypothetical protein